MTPTPNTLPIALVTGATGLVGQALVEKLHAEPVRIRVLVRGVADAFEGDRRIEVVRGDLRDADAVERAVAGVDTVYHLGAAMSGTAEEFDASIVRGTHHIVDACVRHDVRRLVHVSSLGVVEAAARGPEHPVRESSPLDPYPERRGAYTYAKTCAERIVRAATSAGTLRAVIIRPGQIIGPRAAHRCPNATFSLGPAWVVVGPKSQVLPLVYADDVADALVLAGTRDNIDGQVFHIIDPQQVTLGEYLNWHGHLPGRRARAIRVPASLLSYVASVMDVVGWAARKSLPLTRYRVRALRPLAPFDVSVAMQVLGWTPRVGVRTGLLRTFGERRKVPRLVGLGEPHTVKAQ